jgi:hypothetical protein
MLYNIQIYYLHTDSYKEFAINCKIKEIADERNFGYILNIEINHESYIIQKTTMLELFDLQEYVNNIWIMRNNRLKNSEYYIYTESFNVWLNPIND